MKKILYLRSSFDPGGTESLILNLFNYPQKKIQFHLALLKPGVLIENLKNDQNVYYKLFRKYKIDLSVLQKLNNIILQNDIKIVHSHQTFELLYAVLLKLFNPSIKIFHTIHGYHNKHSHWVERIERTLISITHKTFTVSYAARDVLVSKGYNSENIEVLYNAVELANEESKNDMNAFKNRINYQNGDVLIGTIGNFVWGKDQITLVKAFNLLKDEIPRLKVILIGKESAFSEKCKVLLTEKEINSRVYFLGAVENASKYLPLFKVFIMSTLKDTFGIVVIEALLQKIPVIASDIEVMKELSHNGVYFELFEKQNPLNLANKIRQSILQKQEEKLNNAAKYAVINFSFENYIRNLNEFYSQ